MKATCAPDMDRPAEEFHAAGENAMGVMSAMLAKEGSHVDRAMERARLLGLLVIIATLLMAPCRALADTQLDHGMRAADEGRFDEALKLLTRAIEREPLSRDQFLQALEQRVLVYYALHRQTDLERELDLLLAIDPTVSLGSSAPPDLTEAIEKRRQHVQPLHIAAHVEDVRGTVSVWAGSLLVADRRELRTVVGVRSPGGVWQLSYSGQVKYRPPLVGTVDHTVDYFAAVIGPAGTVLASDGREDAPKVHRLHIPLVVETTEPPSLNEVHERRRGLWWTLGSVSAVAVVTSIVVFVARAASPASAEVQSPSVEYP